MDNFLNINEVEKEKNIRKIFECPVSPIKRHGYPLEGLFGWIEPILYGKNIIFFKEKMGLKIIQMEHVLFYFINFSIQGILLYANKKEKLILEVELFGKKEKVKHDVERNLVKLVLMDFTKKKIYKKLELKGPFILDFELKGLGKLCKRNVFTLFLWQIMMTLPVLGKAILILEKKKWRKKNKTLFERN